MYKAAAVKDKQDPAKNGGLITSNRRGSIAQTIASSLLSGNIMLKDAESYSKKSIDAMKLPLYLSEQREAYTKRKQNIPTAEELTKRFKESRASRVATLGRIELKPARPQRERRAARRLTGSIATPRGGCVWRICRQRSNETKALTI
jgi:hypothetical protein